MVGISVVVPTYNRAALISETIDAILNQTRLPDEVIVVDDGSTDDTRNVLAAYGPRVTLVQQPNSGDLVARNHGLRLARGDLVAFCDSDDLWLPDFLLSMEHLFRAEPEITAAYGNFYLLQNGELTTATKFDEAPVGFWDDLRGISAEAGVFDVSIIARMMAFQPFFPSAMVVNRAAFLELGGWDDGVSRIVGCDFATALRTAHALPIGILKRPLVSIRKHASNISGDSVRMNLGDALVLEHVLETRPELAPFRAQIVRSIRGRRINAFEMSYGRMDFREARMIDRLLPAETKSLRMRLKAMIARLPRPLALMIASALDPSWRR